MQDKNYQNDKIKDFFTVYVLQFFRGHRRDYIERKIKAENNTFMLEEISELEDRITLDEIQENKERALKLMRESNGQYPNWTDFSDQKLVKSLLMLSEEERELIYQHVFEEHSFDEMSRITGMTADRCKNIYYYAIRKIRKKMGDKYDGI